VAAWVTEVMMRMKLLNVMGVELLFMKVAMEYLTQQVYPALYRRVQQNHGFVKHVELELQILLVNYVQIQVVSSRRRMLESGFTWCVHCMCLVLHLVKLTSCRA